MVLVHALQVLGAEGIKHKNLWNPTILGFLVVLSAIGLFCGSVYLLLATNLGARLGFLVAAACLTGFLTLLSVLWLTTSTPVNSPHGHIAQWKVAEVVNSPADAKLQGARTISQHGTRVDEQSLANLRPALDSALVTAPQIAGERSTTPQPFAKFSSSTDYLTEVNGKPLNSYIAGGGTRNVIWHNPKYAVVEFCPAKKVTVAPGQKPPAPSCDPLGGTQVAVLTYNYGTLRQPPGMYFVVFLALFLLSLAGLHWHEKDARARRRETLTPVPTNA
jgi:hypothetical protein